MEEHLVPAGHGHVPIVVPDVLRPAMRGPVDVVLRVPHDAEHAADDSQRQHRLQPVKPRHRDPGGEVAASQIEPAGGGGGGDATARFPRA